MHSILPSTPSYPRTPSPHDFYPQTSSPLTGSPMSSPTSAAQARKSGEFTPMYTNRYRSSSSTSRPQLSANALRYSQTSEARRRASAAYSSKKGKEPMGRLFGDELGFQREDGSSMLRDKFKKRCMEKAVKAREAKVQKARKWESSSEPDIDGDVGMSDEAPDDLEKEDEDEGINDELFRRIMASTKHRRQHAYRVSYQDDVGSSWDPDIENWEQELQEGPQPTGARNVPSTFIEPDPDLLDDEDADALAAYAEECAQWEELEQCADEIFSLSDLENEHSAETRPQEDVEMS